MRKVLDIALNDLRVFFKDRGNLVGLIVIPIVMTVVVGIGNGALAGDAPQRVRVDVVDADGTALSADFIQGLRAANRTLALCPFDSGEDDLCGLGDDRTLTLARALERLVDANTTAVVEIPAGFEAKLQAGEPVNVVYHANDALSAQNIALQAVQAVAGRMGGAQVAAALAGRLADSDGLALTDPAARAAFQQSAYERAAELLSADPAAVAYRLSAQPETQITSRQAGFGQSVPGMGSMFVMFTVFGALYVLIRERANWTIQRLVMMPVSRRQILAGKILTWFTLGVIQFLVVFAAGLALGVNFGKDLVALAVVMLAFTLCATALAFAVSTLLKTEIQANSISLLLALTLAPLGGAWWPLDIVPPFMQTLGRISPVAWAMDGFRSLLFEGGNLGTVLLPSAVLLAAAGVFFAFAVWRFRYD